MPHGAKRRVNGKAILIAPRSKDLKDIDSIVQQVRNLAPAQLKSSATEAERQLHTIALAKYRLLLTHLLMSPRPTRTNVAQYLINTGIKYWSVETILNKM